MHLKTMIQTLRKPKNPESAVYRNPLPVIKVLTFSNGYSFPICPRCDCSMDREYTNYCDRCGQKLGWQLFDFAMRIKAPRKK